MGEAKVPFEEDCDDLVLFPNEMPDIGGKTFLFAFGGHEESIEKLNLQTNKWELLMVNMPQEISNYADGLSMFAITENKALIFGGYQKKVI